MAIAMSLLMSFMLSPQPPCTEVVDFVIDVPLMVVTSWGLGFTVGGVGGCFTVLLVCGRFFSL